MPRSKKKTKFKMKKCQFCGRKRRDYLMSGGWCGSCEETGAEKDPKIIIKYAPRKLFTDTN